MHLPCPVPSCTRTRPGHLAICGACSAGLLRDLADVPSLEHHLELALTRQTRIGGGTSPARRDHEGPEEDLALIIRRAPPPWDERARTAQQHLRTTLVGWLRVLQGDIAPYSGPTCVRCGHRSCAHLELSRTPADTLAAMARWLIRQQDRLLTGRHAPETVDGICEAIHQARRVIDRHAGRIYAGPCNVCGTDLLARPSHREVLCRTCDLVYDVAARQDWMREQVEDQLAHSVAISGMLSQLGLEIAASTIRYWGRQKWILARGQDQRNRPLYRIGDVMARHEQRRRRA